MLTRSTGVSLKNARQGILFVSMNGAPECSKGVPECRCAVPEEGHINTFENFDVGLKNWQIRACSQSPTTQDR